MTESIGPDERAYRTLFAAGLERSRQVIRIAQQLDLFGGSVTGADAQYGKQFVPAANLVNVFGTNQGKVEAGGGAVDAGGKIAFCNCSQE